MTNNLNCRISDQELIEIINFGNQPLGNGFLQEGNFNKEYFFEMKLGFCAESKMVQLFNQPKSEKMFNENYLFFSETSKYMQVYFEDLFKNFLSNDYINKNKFIIEIGCNDGIFLKHAAKNNIKCLGIEPSKNVAEISKNKGIEVINNFFTSKLCNEIINEHGKVDLIYAANVMCHIEDIKDVIYGASLLLSDKGLLVFEDPYLLDIIEKTSYDQIYDEHVYLFSLTSVEKLVNLFGLEIFHAERTNTHGGSMRYYISKKNNYNKSENALNYFNKEKKIDLSDVNTYFKFKKNVENSKNDLINLLNQLKKNGKKISGYAATSKSTTILNYCKIDSELIECIYDTTPQKIGLFSPGMHIPVCDFKAFYEAYPDYAFLFAWNHFKEISNKEKKFVESGGKWITHVPNVSLI